MNDPGIIKNQQAARRKQARQFLKNLLGDLPLAVNQLLGGIALRQWIAGNARFRQGVIVVVYVDMMWQEGKR